MNLVAIVIVLALFQYFVFAVMVGRARTRTGIEAPAITGDPVFERTMRVHQNTLEQLVIFLPGIWLFATYVSPRWAAFIGLGFLVGRAMYMHGYVKEPKERGRGFVLTVLVEGVLLLGGGIGAFATLF